MRFTTQHTERPHVGAQMTFDRDDGMVRLFGVRARCVEVLTMYAPPPIYLAVWEAHDTEPTNA